MSHACCLGQVEPLCRGGMGLLKPNLSLCAAEGRNAGMHAGRSHGCDTTCRVTRRGVSEGALQSGSAGAGAARENAVCGEQAHPRAGPRHASCRFHRGILGSEGPWDLGEIALCSVFFVSFISAAHGRYAWVFKSGLFRLNHRHPQSRHTPHGGRFSAPPASVLTLFQVHESNQSVPVAGL